MTEGHIVDVVGRRIYDGSLEIEEGKVISINEHPVPFESPYILPGFVDAHVHIESSMVLPRSFACEALRHGTVAAVCDPHEIANVLGIRGIEYMLDNARGVPFHFWFGAPSCVPCTDLETAGASLGPEEIRALMSRPDIHYLSEMMFYPGVVLGIPDVMAKIQAAKDFGKKIDGHAPGLSGDGLGKYVAAGIDTDHECTSLDEALEKLRAGMKILVREGSAAKNYDELSPLFGMAEAEDKLMFCSDDKHPDDLLKGHIDVLVKNSLSRGYPFWNVLRAATSVPVRHYGIDCGLLQPGDSADFIVIDNLTDFNVLQTFIGGKSAVVSESSCGGPFPNQFDAVRISVDDIKFPAEDGAKIRVIEASDGSLVTGSRIEEALVLDGAAVPDIERDILKIVVCNRYAPAKPQVGFISGFGLTKGALGSTIAHDSHNIIVVGADDESIVTAFNELVSMRGGIVAATPQSVTRLPLPVAGLMSSESVPETAQAYLSLQKAAAEMGCKLASPYMTMSFMALPVIPELKLTDRGLFDANSFNYINVIV